MPRWLFWISYINPVYFNFEALMINEFKGLTLRCVDGLISPRGSGYPTNVSRSWPGRFNHLLTNAPLTLKQVGPNQVCTLPGARGGSQTVGGMDYLKAAFNYKRSNLW